MSLAAPSPTPAYGAQQAVERVAQLQALIARADEPAAAASTRTGGTEAPAATAAAPSSAGSTGASSDFAGALAGAEEQQASVPLASNPGYAAPSTAYPAPTTDYADPATGYAAPASSYAAPASDFGVASPIDGTATPGSYEAEPSAGEAAGAGAYEGMIQEAATRYGVEPAILQGLIQQESDFDPNARSGAGAMGLTQLMPATAAAMGVSDPLDPQQSIEGGARYLGEMLSRFGGNVTDAIAAYNAGPGAVSEHGGVPPYSETESYVSKVLENAASYRSSHIGVIQ